MSSLMQRGSAWMHARLSEQSESIRYLRGTAVIDGIPGLPGRTDIEQMLNGETTIIGTAFTWRVDQTDLMIDNAAINPSVGDSIEWDLGQTTIVFSVLPSVQGISAPVDPYTTRIRVNTKISERRARV